MRQDNADLRLREIGHEIGLVSDEEYERMLGKRQAIEEEIRRLEGTAIGGTPVVQEVLLRYGSTPLKSGSTLAELVRRPELDYEKIGGIDKNARSCPLMCGNRLILRLNMRDIFGGRSSR